MWNHERVKDLIREKGRTREWLAKQCRITVASLNQILSGRTPSRPVVALLAMALEVSEEDLLDAE